jgi:carbamoyltransferase
LVVAIAANEHDSAVAVGDADRVLGVVEAERVTRIKHRWSRARELEWLVELALAEFGRTLDDVTHWCGTAMGNTLLPREERSCESVKPLRVTICGHRRTFIAINHHMAHAAGAFFCSPYSDAMVDVSDAGGDGRTNAVFVGSRSGAHSSLEERPADPHPGLSGMFYDVCSYYLFKKYMQEGRFMGLAGYGASDPDALSWLSEHVIELSTEAHERSYRRLHQRFRIDRFDWRDRACRDFAAAVQDVFVAERVRQVTRNARVTEDIVLAGGTALNIHANARLRATRATSGVFVPPCCEDSGQALGALLYVQSVVLGATPIVEAPFLGLGVSHEANVVSDDTAERVVHDLLSGRVVAWHWGRAEIGPRALGHRSLLSSPLSLDQRRLVSEHVKRREPYRPVAPILLGACRQDWFAGNANSPYMLFAADATRRCRDAAPGVVHVDGTSRFQTVDDAHVLAKILRLFGAATGVPMLINTSLNGPDEPISHTPADTLRLCAAHREVIGVIDGVRHDAV